MTAANEELRAPHLHGHVTTLDSEIGLAASTMAPTAIVSETTSLTRTYAHLHYPTYMGFCALFCGLRTMVYHPMTVALTRKQGLADYGSLKCREILRRMVRTEGGVRTLTTGMGALVCANAFSECIYSGLYECFRYELPIEQDVAREVASGYTADFACRFVYTPLLLVANRQMTQTAPNVAGARTQRQVINRSENSARQTIRNVYRKDGLPGFFRGLAPTITVGCAWSGVWWATYVKSKEMLYGVAPYILPSAEGKVGKRLPSWLIDRSDNIMLNACASVITSSSTAAAFNPFLVVRTRLQVESGSTFRSVVRSVWRESGSRGFFRGTAVNVSTCVVDGIMAASCYEWAKYLADNTHLHAAPNTPATVPAAPSLASA